jgi:hypothetical protein
VKRRVPWMMASRCGKKFAARAKKLTGVKGT